MEVLLKIAFRNLREHKIKTLIIGSIITLGIFVLVLGNSLVDTAESGIRGLYKDNFTGDIVIASSRNESLSLFSMGMNAKRREPPATIRDHARLESYLESLPWVERTSSQITAVASAGFAEGDDSVIQLFGVDPEKYRAMFPDSLEIIAGRFLRGGEEGVVISESVADSIREVSGREVKAGDRILLTAANVVSGTKIREVEVRGIFRFRKTAPNLANISFTDLATARVLTGMNKVIDLTADLSPEERGSLGATDEESLFGEGSALVDRGATEQPVGESVSSSLERALADRSEADIYRAVDPDSYRHVLVKVGKGMSAETAIRALNKHFRDAGLPLVAYGWADAAGSVASIVTGLKTVFDVLAVIVGVVATIIIMNTLVISVSERTGEIGTMRAIGAGKGFVRAMITLETFMISLAFGAIGLCLGVAAVRFAGSLDIATNEPFMQVFFGGPILHPVTTARSLVSSFITVVAVGVLASLYPVAIALKIRPVQAMSR